MPVREKGEEDQCLPVYIEKEVEVVKYRTKIEIRSAALTGCDWSKRDRSSAAGWHSRCAHSIWTDRCAGAEAGCAGRYVDMGCDGVPESGMALDDCGVCGGDGTTCTEVKSRSKLELAACPTAAQVDEMRAALAVQVRPDLSRLDSRSQPTRLTVPADSTGGMN